MSIRDTVAENSEPEFIHTPRRLVPGERFAKRYDIDAMIGEGGMGAVYRVHDSVLKEIVALKILKLQAKDTQFYADLFCQEVKLSRRITHANVVHVYDIGEANSMLYMTMEFIDGITLRRAMHQTYDRKIPIREAIRIAHGLANGLAAVHAQAIVHRDLKPGNVMIDRKGRVVLADFGIASQIVSDGAAKSGSVVGTISYMAPELFAQQPPSPQSDLYAFGLVLFEALTGSLPQRDECWWLKKTNEPIRVDLLEYGVVGNVLEIGVTERVLRWCLEADPSARPRSAEEVSHELGTILYSSEGTRMLAGSRTMERTISTEKMRAHLPGDSATLVISEPRTMEVADLIAEGIEREVAMDYLEARNKSRLNDEAHMIAAFEGIESCIQRAPSFKRAIATRAVIAARCWFYDRTAISGIQWEITATECVDNAIEIAPELSDTHLAMGILAAQRCEMKQAGRALIRAIEINPASAEAQEYLGSIEIDTGLIERGLPRVLYGAGAIPLRPLPCITLARCYALLGRFEEAEQQIIQANKRAGIATLGGLLYSIRLHAYRTRAQQFQPSISQQKAIKEDIWVGIRHYLDALVGKADPRVVMDWIDSADARVSNCRVNMILRQVCVEMCAMLGEIDKALDVLAECARNGLIDIFWVDHCPLIPAIRTTERYGEIRDWVWLNAYGVWN